MTSGKDIKKIVDEHAISLVGVLCKRIELIEKISKDKSSQELISLYPELFKSLAKELVYENCRVLIHKLSISLIPTVVYREKS